MEVIVDSRNITFFGRVVGLLDFAYIDEDRFNTETREHAAYNITDGLEFYLEGRWGNFTTRWGQTDRAVGRVYGSDLGPGR